MGRLVFCLAALLPPPRRCGAAQSVAVPAQPGYAMNPPAADSPLQQQILRNYRSDLQQAQRELAARNPSGLSREQLDVTHRLNAVNSALNPVPPPTMTPAAASGGPGGRRQRRFGDRGARSSAMPAEPLATESGEDALAAAAPRLNAWLLAEGRFLTDNGELFGAFCERSPPPACRSTAPRCISRALHPRYRGVSRIWRPGQGLPSSFSITVWKRPRPISKARCGP